MGEPLGRALEGMLVVALEQAVAAPLCTSRLADAGARVIKIERPASHMGRAPISSGSTAARSRSPWISRIRRIRRC